MWDNVTIVLASDFGRTLTSNTQGTDHGRGGNTFILGGNVPSATFCYLDILQLVFGGILVPKITVIPTLGSLLKLEQVLAVLL